MIDIYTVYDADGKPAISACFVTIKAAQGQIDNWEKRFGKSSQGLYVDVVKRDQ